MVTAVLAESAPLAQPSDIEGKGIWRARLIEADVEGSSGFYPAEVLKRDGPAAFPAGTHVYYDHPSSNEENDRPERSVRDLAGYLVDDAGFEEGPDGNGLFARIQFVEGAKSLAQSLAPIIGLSIRASGDIENTPSGKVVRSIREGVSVDLVTRAGAGGRLVNMTESTKPVSPPAEETKSKAATEVNIPSTIGAGSLVNEVSSLKESISDRFQEFSVEIARLGQQLRESQRETEKLLRENRTLSETVTFLRERQEASDAKLGEAKSIGDTLAEILESGVPEPSMIRIAQTYRFGQDDLHESIKREREYLKKVWRESERSGLSKSETGNLGLTESALRSDTTTVSDEDFGEIESVLSGKQLF
ncbi:hypothetical protein [Streptomyces sp. 5-10]|uniref:hypothetical protein n=1 Tax=Streptomyces sp. 5-10 TaxID=878925 RepID=UPI00168B3939|nr:hypothetical protein [Streptomyces sp. 5-10]MBD3004539.1 hypothetical protein [Streptomyces sp. 5-10]